MPSSVAFDDQVRSYLGFLRHFLVKQALLRQDFEMAQISAIPIRFGNTSNEERSTFFMQNAAQKKSPSKQDTRDNGLKTMFWSKKLSPGKQRVNAIADNESVV